MVRTDLRHLSTVTAVQLGFTLRSVLNTVQYVIQLNKPFLGYTKKENKFNKVKRKHVNI